MNQQKTTSNVLAKNDDRLCHETPEMGPEGLIATIQDNEELALALKKHIEHK